MKELSWSRTSDRNPYSKILRTGLILIGGVFSFFLGALLLPSFVQSSLAAGTQTFWYLSRASGIIAFVFLWLSMLLGLLKTTGLIPRGKSSAFTLDLHQFVSLWGLLFSGLHDLLLLGDSYLNLQFWQLLVPFTVFSYRPLNVGAGQIGLYLWGVLVLSSFVRKSIGRATWRVLHYLSFGAFWLVLLHGITAGSDTATAGMQMLYWGSATSMVFLLIYRILSAIFSNSQE
jgi:sulfoxide reductase heme-binding subunit YedZ